MSRFIGLSFTDVKTWQHLWLCWYKSKLETWIPSVNWGIFLLVFIGLTSFDFLLYLYGLKLKLSSLIKLSFFYVWHVTISSFFPFSFISTNDCFRSCYLSSAFLLQIFFSAVIRIYVFMLSIYKFFPYLKSSFPTA